jgi:hypothetical protein
MDYYGDMLNRTRNAGVFKRQPAMNIQRAVYNGGQYDASKRSLDDSISTSQATIVKRDRGQHPPRHALYEHSRSPKRRRILPNNDLRGVDPNIISIPKINPGIDGSNGAVVPLPRSHSEKWERSVSSTASGSRSSSYASHLSVAASNLISMHSHGRLSPGRISLGSDDAQPAPLEASAERSTGEPEIVYSLGDDVILALKQKIPSSETDEPRLIRGSVVRVIGQGKSRRYEVKDLKLDQDNPGGNAYKSRASQMVPIPEGTSLTVSVLNPKTTGHILSWASNNNAFNPVLFSRCGSKRLSQGLLSAVKSQYCR